MEDKWIGICYNKMLLLCLIKGICKYLYNDSRQNMQIKLTQPEVHSKEQQGSAFENIKVIGSEMFELLPFMMFASCGLLFSIGVSSYLLHCET